MHLSYTVPLERAYEHMKGMLFAPFDLAKWLVVGFGCWLAYLTDGGFGGSFPSGTANLHDDSDGATLTAWGWPEALWEEGCLLGCGAFAAFLVAFILVLIPLLIWLSSRGHFVFLDNVVRDRAEIREPWNRFATQGNSLFLWRIGFLFAAIFLVVLAAVPLATIMFWVANRGGFEVGEAAAVALGVVPIVAVAVGLAYAHLFLIHFVVPIMRQEGLTTNAAWSRFLPLLSEHFGGFLVYGLFLLLLWTLIGCALLVVVFCTCCIAAIPLIVPYVSTVTLLPIYVTFRAYSVEFLGQLVPAIGLPPAVATGGAELPQPPALA